MFRSALKSIRAKFSGRTFSKTAKKFKLILNARKHRPKLFVIGTALIISGSLLLISDVKKVMASREPKQKPEPNQELTSSSGIPAFSGPPGKKHVVILGTGWGAISALQSIGSDYYVTVISPRNYFLFTPMLPSVTTGKLEDRSIITPVRRLIKYSPNANFFEATCTSIDPDTNSVVCEDSSGVVGEVSKFRLSYDYLIISVGAQNNTFGTPGVYENANFLKSVEDSVKIRSQIIDCFETANYPGNSEEERKRLLSFVVVGGGPTGVEFIGEMTDFLTEDIKKYYPHLVNDVSMTLIQSQDHILNTFDSRISEYVETKFKTDKINVKTNQRVKEVKDKSVVVFDKTTNKSYELPFGVCVWSTGITRTPLVKEFCDKLKDKGQVNTVAIVVDNYLRVKGASNVFAIGDCSTMERKFLKEKLDALFDSADIDHNGKVSWEELSDFIKKFSVQYPQLQVYSSRILQTFNDFDYDKSGNLEREEFRQLIESADRQVTVLPTTAQVASQQGKYVGTLLNSIFLEKSLIPFQYKHSGSFAFVGSGNAVAEIPGIVNGGGLGVWMMWKGIYLSKLYSMRNRISVMMDWFRAFFFGRDISRF